MKPNVSSRNNILSFNQTHGSKGINAQCWIQQFQIACISSLCWTDQLFWKLIHIMSEEGSWPESYLSMFSRITLWIIPALCVQQSHIFILFMELNCLLIDITCYIQFVLFIWILERSSMRFYKGNKIAIFRSDFTQDIWPGNVFMCLFVIVHHMQGCCILFYIRLCQFL